MSKHIVAGVDEIAPGQSKIVDVEGRLIGVFNVDGVYFALRNVCPHQGAPLCEGLVWSSVTSTRPGEYLAGEDGPFLRCPWHGWEYDMRTGQSWFDPGSRVKTFEVSVSTCPRLVGDSARAEGPYVAETYGVAVDDRFVVVEIPDRKPS